MKAFMGLIVALLNISFYSGETIKDVQELYDTIFQNENYNKHLRGAVDQSKTIRVLTNFSLLGIGNIIEIKEAFEVIGILQMSWTDERLMWKPENFNGSKGLLLHEDMIWKPKVTLSNQLLDVDVIGEDHTYIRIYHNGRILWSKPRLFKAICEIDVVSFPWDRQSCALKFMVSGYSQEEVTIDIDQPNVDLSLFEEHESWNLLKTAAVSMFQLNSRVEYRFCVERIPDFHFSVVFFPVVTLSILSIFTFLVKIDSGERISFSVTLLLSITVDLTMMSDLLPTHSRKMASIIYYLNAVLGQSALTCIISILNLRMYHRHGSPPDLLQRIYNILVCKRFVRQIEIQSESNEYRQEIMKEDIDGGTNRNIPDVVGSWVDMSHMIDRVCFTLSCFFTIIIHLVFGLNVSIYNVTCSN